MQLHLWHWMLPNVLERLYLLHRMHELVHGLVHRWLLRPVYRQLRNHVSRPVWRWMPRWVRGRLHRGWLSDALHGRMRQQLQPLLQRSRHFGDIGALTLSSGLGYILVEQRAGWLWFQPQPPLLPIV
jgi:hypothetical protein